MRRESLKLTLLLVVTASLISCSSPKKTTLKEMPLIDQQGRPSLDYFKHRDKLYSIRDLMDPAFIANSDDEFVRNFNIDPTLASELMWSEARASVEGFARLRVMPIIIRISSCPACDSESGMQVDPDWYGENFKIFCIQCGVIDMSHDYEPYNQNPREIDQSLDQ